MEVILDWEVNIAEVWVTQFGAEDMGRDFQAAGQQVQRLRVREDGQVVGMCMGGGGDLT
jgi:hypothetical protein